MGYRLDVVGGQRLVRRDRLGAVGLDYYLLDVARGRWESWELRDRIVALSEGWRADVTLIEKTHLGYALLQDLRWTGALAPILMPPRYDKEARLQAQSARFEAGQVYLPTEAPWLGEYISELLAFPNGRYDDQVDATTYALHYLTARRPRVEPSVRRSRDSIRGVKRRAEGVEAISGAAASNALPPDGTRETFEDGHRIVHVPASFQIPQPEKSDEKTRRKARR